MDDTIYKNGRFIDASADSDAPFVYQYIRTDGHRALQMQRRMELLDAASWRIRRAPSGLDAGRTAAAVERLLMHNGYPNHGSHIVLLRSYGNSEYALSCHGTSIYDGLALRALRPLATIVESGGIFDGLPTSASLASARLLREYAATLGCGAFVATDGAGRVVSVDGGTPVIITRGVITVSESSMTVEAEAVMKAFERDGRRMEIRDFSRSELLAADELAGIDQRGITSVAECDGTAYSDIILDVTAQRL